MAQVVLIDTDTARPGQEVGDVVSIHDDKVELSGLAYKGFRIVHVDGTVDEVRKTLFAKIPEKKTVTFWKNPSDGTWHVLANEPKFSVTLKNLTSDIASLTDIDTAVEEKIHLDAKNFTTKSDIISLDTLKVT